MKKLAKSIMNEIHKKYPETKGYELKFVPLKDDEWGCSRIPGRIIGIECDSICDKCKKNICYCGK